MRLLRALVVIGLFVFSVPVPAVAQTAALLPVPRLQFFDANGYPLAGGKVYTYAAGTSTPLATYTDSTGVTANPNPIILDSGGFANIWIKSGSYKIVVQDSSSVQQWTQDNVTNAALAQAGQIGGSNGAAYINYTPTATGAVTRTVAARLGDRINAADFGAVCDGSTDNAVAFGKLATFVNATTSVYTVSFPAGGSCLYTGGLWFTKPVIVDLSGATLNYTGAGIALELGARTLTYPDVAANRYFEVRNGIMTGGGSMTNGIFVNPYLTEVRINNVRQLNFGNAAAYGIWLQAQNWDTVIEDSSFIVDFNASNIQRNWIWNAGTSDNGQSRLRVIRCHGTHLVSAGGVGVYTNGFNSEISSSKIEGFTPNIVVGSFATATTISNTYLEGTRPGLKGCIQYGDLSGSQIGTFIRNLHVLNTYCNVHNTDASLTTALLAPSTTSTGLTYAIVEGNSVGAKTTGLPLVALNNSAGQIGNFGTNNWMVSQDGNTWGMIDVLHTAGANIAGWTGTQGEQIDFTQAPTDAARFFDIKAGATADQFEGVRLYDRLGVLRGQMYRSPSGYLILGSGSADGISFNSDGSFTVPKGFTNNGFGTFNSPAIAATPVYVNAFAGQTAPLVDIRDSSSNPLFRVNSNGYIQYGASSVGITVTKNLTGSGGSPCTQTFVGGILTASTCP